MRRHHGKPIRPKTLIFRGAKGNPKPVSNHSHHRSGYFTSPIHRLMENA